MNRDEKPKSEKNKTKQNKKKTGKLNHHHHNTIKNFFFFWREGYTLDTTSSFDKETKSKN
jgi:hypothetical protein